MRLAILPRYIDLEVEGSVWNRRHYIVHQYERMAKEFRIGLCNIMSPYGFEEVCELCDGLIIPGSSTKVNPSYYGEEPMNPPPVYDEFALDLKLMDYFIKREKPILGICAGHQALNIYFGGTIGRIPGNDPHKNVTHLIKIKEDSFVYDAFGCESVTVNSHHVLEIKKLGRGLDVVATSEEGIIEAVENKEKKIFATQWHPERCFEGGNSSEKKIFENFLACCKK